MEEINGCTVITPDDAAEALTWGAEETGGAYTALVGVMPPNHDSTPLHLHPSTDEAFYVAQGTCGFQLGDEKITAETGSLVFVPRGTVHTVWNPGSEPVRGLILISPANGEHEFVPVDAD
jgi:quercetin dioxygenase-like cupin family protein